MLTEAHKALVNLFRRAETGVRGVDDVRAEFVNMDDVCKGADEQWMASIEGALEHADSSPVKSFTSEYSTMEKRVGLELDKENALDKAKRFKTSD